MTGMINAKVNTNTNPNSRLQRMVRVAGLAVLVTLPLTGCMSFTGLVKQLAKDPAVVSLKVRTLYGSGELVRAGSNTNSVQITEEGEVVVNPRGEGR